MRVPVALTMSCLALLAAVPALAADLDASSRIDTVTVFPDAASVTRVAELDLPAGATTVVFRNLPNDLDPASLRVQGESSGRLTIGSVESRSSAAPSLPETDLGVRIKSLKANRDAVQVTVDALAAKKAMILKFAQSSPERLAGDGKPLEIGQWDKAWDSVQSALLKVGNEIREAQANAADLDAQIQGLEQERTRPAARVVPARDVTVALDSDGAAKARLTLTYRIGDASWAAVYDARLDTGVATKKPSLDLVRRATVTQHTGEDWTDVSLSVSTVRTDRGTAAPDIQPMQVSFAEPAEAVFSRAAPGRHAFKRKMAAPEADEAAPPASMAGAVAPAAPKPAEEARSTLDSGPFQASFHVGGRVAVPSDGSEKSFLLGSQTLKPTLTVKTIPSRDQTAFITAQIVNEGDAPLLPGTVALLRDGTFVGSGDIRLVAPGDTLDLGFGADDRVKVARVPVKRKENDPLWVGTNKTESDEFKTTVRNLHDFPVKVSVVDQIPISETTTIVIEQLSVTTPPTEKIVGDKRGVMGWTFDLGPNESKDIRLAYRMKWPSDRDVVLEEAPVQAH